MITVTAERLRDQIAAVCRAWGMADDAVQTHEAEYSKHPAEQ